MSTMPTTYTPASETVAGRVLAAIRAGTTDGSIAALAEATGAPASQVRVHLTALVRAGLVRRVPLRYVAVEEE